MKLKAITAAIRLADLDKVKKVEVDMEDLLLLVEVIESEKATITKLTKDLIKSGNAYSALLTQALSVYNVKHLKEYV